MGLRTSRAEDAGHEADDAARGGAQPDPGSMVDDSMPELRREAEALGADAVALAEAYSPASRQRAGAFGLSAGVAVDVRLGCAVFDAVSASSDFGGHGHIQLLSGRAKSCVGGSGTACFATEHESRGMRPSTEIGGMRSRADNRSSGRWADSGRAEVAVVS